MERTMTRILPSFVLAAALVLPGLALAEEGGAAAGAIGGGAAGAAVGGPVGAAVGAGAGAVIGGAASGHREPDVIVEHHDDMTGTVVDSCRSKTVHEQNAMGETRTTTTQKCP
jgi:hypothetical protein